jgi:glutamyl-tRNA reductase
VKFVAVGLSHKTAPLEVREKVFIPETSIGQCLRRLVDREVIESGVLLSTCNRTELYAMTSDAEGPDRVLRSFGWWPHELPIETWRRYAYGLTDDDALVHLLRVAGGLESMVLGEAQVLGQLKAALAQARAEGAVDARLQIIVQGALRAGKRVRHETELGRRPVSVSHAAVARCQEVLGHLSDRGVLVVGAGAMNAIALRLLKNQQVGDVYLTSRTSERADRLAERVGGRPVEFDEVGGLIDRVDIIITSTSASDHVFDARRIRALQARRDFRPLLIIDLAVPRDVDPDADQVAGVHLFNIDDLQFVATNNLDERQASAPAAESIVAQELVRIRHALEARESAPVVEALVRRVERLRDRELERQLAGVSPDDVRTRSAMQHLAEALTAKFLDGPVRTLRNSPDPALEASVLTEAFALESDEASSG